MKKLKIKITIGQDEFIATMNDGKAATEFIALLPMTMTLEDYVGKEKISDLPNRLSTAGSPDGAKASTGDITYFAPWGNIAIFYKNSGYATGLIKLGRIDTDAEKLALYRKPIEARIEIIEE